MSRSPDLLVGLESLIVNPSHVVRFYKPYGIVWYAPLAIFDLKLDRDIDSSNTESKKHHGEGQTIYPELSRFHLQG